MICLKISKYKNRNLDNNILMNRDNDFKDYIDNPKFFLDQLYTQNPNFAQQWTDEFVKKVDQALAAKEKEITQV